MHRLLSAADFHPLYECFLEAFSDYQVSLQMSEEQFEQRVKRDGVELEISAGAFDGERMIGFYMNGRGNWHGKETAYDAGTGVIPSHRRRGVAEKLFDFMVPQLKERGIQQYLLEVLTSNERAVSLYRKLGFDEVRRLAVLRSNEPLKTPGEIEDVSLRRLEEPEWDVFCAYWDGEPSWQNSIDAVERVRNQCEIVGAFVGEQCVGYGIVFKPSSILMQLAVAQGFRRRGIGRKILEALSGDGILKTNNVDEDLRGTLAFYKATGFEVVLRQFEMVREL
ncbi:MAG TPA: GNAT family N-acetyltransferase [Pyrinomonadaceae bacterium]|jgi:ribosomal protein S18 acetylase RimI-like enzyme|nr:GNAT family N-acetyltransferase [Pyrinomonadaceae bacterium]